MCGICGLCGPESSEVLARDVARMTRTIGHRGPDDSGEFVGEGVALGHRRLSILDLSSAGAQPMTFGGATLVFNGEVYNFRLLGAELQSLGHTFRGHSDTEVLLHAYQQWGLSGLDRLEGIFAFALWDDARRRLVLMRDRLGVKPLFYAHSGRCLAFGSEIKAVLAAAPTDGLVDEQALAEYLWYGNPFEERTIYRSVRALPPGGRLVVEDGKERLETWWRLEEWLRQPALAMDRQEAAAAVLAAIDAAVGRQLASDVPVGLFLSGGIDSSSVAAAAAVGSGGRLSSYSVGFDYEHGVNELPQARLVAQHLGLDHHELHVRGDRLEETIASLVLSHDEPFADAANIPLFLLARELKGRIKVVLQGDGGDELFAGYRRYAILSAACLWRLWPRALGGLIRALPGEQGARLSRMGNAAGQRDAALRMALLLTVETLTDPPSRVFRRDMREHLAARTDPFAAFRRCAERFANEDPVEQMLFTDMSLQLPSQFLAKVDRATMAQGIEARVPLLDEGVAALAARLPVDLKVCRLQKKVVLRDSMRGRLPSEILDGPKRGFGVPYEEWLRTKLYAFAKASILEPSFIERFGLERTELETALQEHHLRRKDRGFLLWKMLQLALWSKQYLS